MTASRDFFISFNRADRDWAAWIAWTLEQHGYSVYFQDWDFTTGANFVLEMDRASRDSKAVILVLSNDFLNSSFASAEWAAFFTQDPAGVQQTIKPIRVRECRPEGLLASLVYTDLVGLTENDARAALLSSIAAARPKPKTPTAFPGSPAAIYPGPRLAGADGPILWVYVSGSLPPNDPRYATVVGELRSAAQFQLIEVGGSGRLDEADLAVVVLDDSNPVDLWLGAVRRDLQNLRQNRIPTSVYVSTQLRDSADEDKALKSVLDELTSPAAAVFSSEGELTTTLKADLARIVGRLRQSIEEDGYLVSEHRAILAQTRSGSYARAERMCRSLLESRPFSPRAHYNLACCLTRRAEAAKGAAQRRKLLDGAQEALAEAVRFGIVQFTREFVIGESRSQKDAEKQIREDPDLQTLFEDRPHLRQSIEDPKRIRSWAGGGGGCIEAAMPVELSDGTWIPLYELADSCSVMCWDEQRQAASSGTAANIRHYVVPQLVVINEGLRLSPMHPVLTVDGWRRASEITPGDRVVQSNGTVRQVICVRTAIGVFDVIDLVVSPHSNLSARGSIVHNVKQK